MTTDFRRSIVIGNSAFVIGTESASALPQGSETNPNGKGQAMLWTIAMVLLLMWLLGWLIFPIAGAILHVLLIVALVAFVIQLFRGPAPAP